MSHSPSSTVKSLVRGVAEMVTSRRKDTNPESFRNKHSLEKRKAEADRIRLKYPDRVPIIVVMAPQSNLPPIDKQKYLVPSDLTMGQFIYVIRKRIKLPSDTAIFVFVNNALAPAASLISQVDKQHRDEDNFLYLVVSSESTFG